MEDRKSAGVEHENDPEKDKVMVERWLPKDLRIRASGAQNNLEKLRNAYSSIQPCKEQPEASSEDWGCNALHSERCTRQGAPQDRRGLVCTAGKHRF